MRRCRMKVHGRVQGVGFRVHTLSQAERYHIKGWVKNQPDGTVEIDAEGEDNEMSSFIRAVKEGNPLAKVTDMKSSDIPEKGEFTSFHIRR